MNPTNVTIPISFTGQVFDSQTGLSYHAARWYDPATGRFMSEDPIGEGANHYRYAGNDPVNFYDPTGLSQAGNPLNALAGGYSGGKVAPAPKLNVNALNSPTLNYNPLGKNSYSAGPARSSGSSKVNRSNSYGTTVPGTLFGTPSVGPGRVNTVAVPSFIQQQRAPQATPIAVSQATAREQLIRQDLRDRTFAEFSKPIIAAPTVGGNGRPIPTIEGATQAQNDQSRLRYLQNEYDTFQLRSGTAESREYDRLALSQASPGQKFDIALNALVGFAGGYSPPGTPLSARQPLPVPARFTASKVAGEQGRNAQGQFLPRLVGDARPGSTAEQAVFDAIARKPGWQVIDKPVAVRDSTGQLRVYDGAARTPSGKYIGLETKQGGATQTSAQQAFDSLLNSSRGNSAPGVGQSSLYTIQRAVVVRR